MHTTTCLALILLFCHHVLAAEATDLPAQTHAVDVCVYGGTASGVMAAVTAAQAGHRVLLVEPSNHLGGMTGGGIGTIDYGMRRTIGGLTNDYFNAYHKLGTEPSQPQLEAGLRALLTTHKVAILHHYRLVGVQRQELRIQTISLEHAPVDKYGAPAPQATASPRIHVAARIFIDGSYEGDLMAGARVSYATGREASAMYGESLAGRRPPAHIFPVDPFIIPGNPTSGLLPLVSADDNLPIGAADQGVPACNFRLQLTKNPAERAAFPDFGDYDPGQFEILGRWMEVQVQSGKTPKLPFAIYHGKEFNENRDELVSLALIAGINDYIDGDWATRARVWHEHERYTVGLFRFLATDPRVPASLRNEAAAWGLRRDAFPLTDGWPHQLYIRQGRRLIGKYVITQNDLDGSTAANDIVAIGSYKVDLYHSRRYACAEGIAVEGKVFTAIKTDTAVSKAKGDNNGSRPYGISYRSLIPRDHECDNLIVPVCLSASNVADSSIRMEPVYMIIGEAAGHAAAQAISENCAVQNISFAALQTRLLAAGQVLSLP